MKWTKDIYTIIPKDLDLQKPLVWYDTIDPTWVISDEKPNEAVLQLIISLYIKEITSENMTFLGGSGRYWGEVDILGLDPLGRIHLFELKNSKITEEAVRQLGHYLLNKIFMRPEEFVSHWEKRTKCVDFSPINLKKLLLGFYLGMRSDNKGRKLIKEILNINYSKIQWTKLDSSKRNELLMNALYKQGEILNKEMPDNIDDIVEKIRRKLFSNLDELKRGYKCIHPAVIWLVGSSFEQDNVTKLIRTWRTAGLDTRVLEAEIKIVNDSHYMLRLKRENYPERERLLNTLLSFLQKQPQQDTIIRRINLYEETTASSTIEEKNLGGLPLPEEKVSALLELNGKQLKIKIHKIA